MAKFTVFDVETPNSHSDRICSIGLTYIVDNEIIGSEHFLVNPETFFSQINIEIHGITPAMVENEPTFDKLWNSKIKNELTDCIVMAHNASSTDLCVLRKTLEYYNIKMPVINYICTLRLAEAIRGRGCGRNTLDNLCEEFEIDFFNHHNAGADSMACAQVYLHFLNTYKFDYKEQIRQYPVQDTSYKHICAPQAPKLLKYTEETQCLQMLQGILIGITSDNILNESEVISLTNWLNTNLNLAGHYPFDRVYTVVNKALEDNILEQWELDEMLTIFKSFTDPVNSSCRNCEAITIDGKMICLTGDFEIEIRSNLEQKLTSLGAVCKSDVQRKTDYVIVGSLGSPNWKYGNFGSKVQKAKEYNDKGCNITIIKECDFLVALGDKL